VSILTVANIVANGLPPLGKRSHSSSAGSSSRGQSNYGVKIKVLGGKFGILDDFESENLVVHRSVIWDTARGTEDRRLPTWSGEAEIQTHVTTVLQDCSKAAGLAPLITILREETLSIADAMGKGNRGDTTVIVNDTQMLTGVAEVKLPKFDFRKTFQIVDYMIDLRNSFNVRFVYGILTTYEEWSILWFKDTNDAAKSTSRKEYDSLCMAGSANDYSIGETVTVYQSKIYKCTEPALTAALASVLYKMSKSPIYIPSKYVDERARYIHATKTDIKFRKLPNGMTFLYSMPPVQTVNFYILSYFHRGGDGRVALVASESGHLAIAKFLLGADTMSKLEVEKQNWGILWGVNCRIIDLNERHGLLIPYCMTFNQFRKVGQRFSSLPTWNKRLSNVEDDTVSDELNEPINFPMLQMYQKDPLSVAEQALATMSLKSAVHLDLELRHLALLPVTNNVTNIYDLKPILIDLTRVSMSVNREDAVKAATDGLTYLKEQLESIA
jgi:Family of unknown function (DUF5898)